MFQKRAKHHRKRTPKSWLDLSCVCVCVCPFNYFYSSSVKCFAFLPLDDDYTLSLFFFSFNDALSLFYFNVPKRNKKKLVRTRSLLLISGERKGFEFVFGRHTICNQLIVVLIINNIPFVYSTGKKDYLIWRGRRRERERTSWRSCLAVEAGGFHHHQHHHPRRYYYSSGLWLSRSV